MQSPTASFVSVLKQCESASGAGSKDVIKKALATLDVNGQTLFKYAMDMMLVFGVKKFDMPSMSGPVQYSSTDNHDLKIITRTLDALAARQLTGNAARTAVTTMLGEFTEETAKYLARVVDKDLQAGFSVETYNKIHKNNQVSTFEVMLADKCTTEEQFEEIFPDENTEALADIKYDGERNVAIVTSKGITHHSRSGKIAEHMVGLFDTELLAIRARLGHDFILDGERMARTYIDTINAKKSGPEGEAAKKNMVFRAFFLMPLSDWVAKKTTITMRQVRMNIAALIEELGLEKIILSDSVIVKNYSEMMRELDRVTTPGFQDMPNGQEGLIVKRLDATYQWDRTIDWCKVKKFYDADARIISWEFGKKKNAKRMGRVNVAGWLEDGTYFECGVGSGWNDPQREEFAANFEKFEGKTVVIKYQEVSKGKNKEHASLRFPTVDQEKLFRDDKIVPLKD